MKRTLILITLLAFVVPAFGQVDDADPIPVDFRSTITDDCSPTIRFNDGPDPIERTCDPVRVQTIEATLKHQDIEPPVAAHQVSMTTDRELDVRESIADFLRGEYDILLLWDLPLVVVDSACNNAEDCGAAINAVCAAIGHPTRLQTFSAQNGCSGECGDDAQFISVEVTCPTAN